MMELERLSYIQNNQKKLRVDKYCRLNETKQIVNTEGSNKGKRVVIPSNYIKSRRYIDQLYFDGMEM